jgi:hypothetical protein
MRYTRVLLLLLALAAQGCTNPLTGPSCTPVHAEVKQQIWTTLDGKLALVTVWVPATKTCE